MSGQLLAHLLFVIVLLLPLQAVKGIEALNRQVLLRRGARLEFYRMAITGQWVMMPLVVFAVWPSPSISESLGLRLPSMTAEQQAIVLLMSLLAISQSPLIPAVRRRLASSASARRALTPIRNLLPRSDLEKQRWIAVALTAGICEEVIFRGFLFHYLQSVLGLSLYWTVVVSSLIFAVSHYYQGPTNVLRVGAVGLMLAIAYAVSGTLLIPIAVHVALDLGGLYMGELVAADDTGRLELDRTNDDDPD